MSERLDKILGGVLILFALGGIFSWMVGVLTHQQDMAIRGLLEVWFFFWLIDKRAGAK